VIGRGTKLDLLAVISNSAMIARRVFLPLEVLMLNERKLPKQWRGRPRTDRDGFDYCGDRLEALGSLELDEEAPCLATW